MRTGTLARADEYGYISHVRTESQVNDDEEYDSFSEGESDDDDNEEETRMNLYLPPPFGKFQALIPPIVKK